MQAIKRMVTTGVLALALVGGAQVAVGASDAEAARGYRATYELGAFNSYAACASATRAKLTQLGFYGGSRPYSSWCGQYRVPGTNTYKWFGGIWVQY